MPRSMTIGILVGLLFGVISVWQGTGAAALVLFYTVLGWLLGTGIWFAKRIIVNNLDVTALSELLARIFPGHRRS